MRVPGGFKTSPLPCPSPEALAAEYGTLEYDGGCRFADAGEWQPDEKCDAVLLDAPCSATGTIRLHSDIPHLKKNEDADKLSQIQQHLFKAALKMVKPGVK